MRARQKHNKNGLTLRRKNERKRERERERDTYIKGDKKPMETAWNRYGNGTSSPYEDHGGIIAAIFMNAIPMLLRRT